MTSAAAEAAAVAALRAEFPVLARTAYLNAGTDGPIPRRATEAAATRMLEELERGRGGEHHFLGLQELAARLRARLATLLGCAPGAVGLTRSTTDGVNTVMGGLELGAGDEVLTSDEEHPGLLAPLAAARARRGFTIRVAPFASLPGEVGPRTRLVACSHVSWVNGAVVDAAALAETDALVLLDGAQGLGAVPVDVAALGCDFYAASGQKWLCGPDGSGSLFVHPRRLDELRPSWPGYPSLEDPSTALELPYRPDAARYDVGVLPGPAGAWSLAAHEMLAETGWEWVHGRAAGLAARLAELLAERGMDVASRGPSTLVSWRSPDAEAEVRRLAEAGYVVRQLPGRGLVRASVGAWSTEAEIAGLASLAGGTAA